MTEIVSLRNKKLLHPSSQLYALLPFLDCQGILREQGLLERGAFSETAEHPVVLHHESPVERMVIMDTHIKLDHEGIERTTSDFRQQYHVTRFRQTISKYLGRCPPCRRLKSLYSTIFL